MPATAIPPKPKPVYPRPPVAVLHTELFKEAVYEDGQAYADQDEDGDVDPAGLPR